MVEWLMSASQRPATKIVNRFDSWRAEVMSVNGASFLLLMCLAIDVIIIAKHVDYCLAEERQRLRFTLRWLLVLMVIIAPQLWLLSRALQRP